MLFSTHITSDLERIAADVALLKDNQIKYIGDLSELKEKIIKLHIQSERELKMDDLSIGNILSSNLSGKIATVTVEDFERNEIESLERKLNAKITIEQLSLEDIFLEMNR